MSPSRRAGLSFGSPALESAGFNPAMPFSSTGVASTQQQSPIDYLADYSNSVASAASVFAPAQPSVPQGPQVYFNPQARRVSVNGFMFDENNASQALQSEQYLNHPAQTPEGDGWTQIPLEEYQNYLEGIRNPGTSRLFGEGFQRGLRGLGQLYGAGLQFAGFEEAGSNIINEIQHGYERDAPYQRQFRDIETPSDAVDWFVSAVGETLPSVLESIATAAVGWAAGTASTGNPLTGAAGGLATLFGKQAFRAEAVAAARAFAAQRARGLTARDALEAIGTQQATILRQVSGAGGALIATAANNYGTGVADTYNELRTGGSQPGDLNARIAALGYAAPYAALETLPEFILGMRAIGPHIGMVENPRGVAGAGINILQTAGLTAAGEGLTEAGQEGLIMNANSLVNNRQLLPDEALGRIIESGAAGAAGGLIFGLGGGAVGSLPTDLTQRRPGGPVTPDPTEATPPIQPRAGLRGPGVATEYPGSVFNEEPIIPGPENLPPFVPTVQNAVTTEYPGSVFNPAIMDVAGGIPGATDQGEVFSAQPGPVQPVQQEPLNVQPAPAVSEPIRQHTPAEIRMRRGARADVARQEDQAAVPEEFRNPEAIAATARAVRQQGERITKFGREDDIIERRRREARGEPEGTQQQEPPKAKKLKKPKQPALVDTSAEYAALEEKMYLDHLTDNELKRFNVLRAERGKKEITQQDIDEAYNYGMQPEEGQTDLPEMAEIRQSLESGEPNDAAQAFINEQKEKIKSGATSLGAVRRKIGGIVSNAKQKRGKYTAEQADRIAKAFPAPLKKESEFVRKRKAEKAERAAAMEQEQRENIAKAATKAEEEANAVQKRSTEEVDARKPSRPGERVRRGNAAKQEIAPTSEEREDRKAEEKLKEVAKKADAVVTARRTGGNLIGKKSDLRLEVKMNMDAAKRFVEENKDNKALHEQVQSVQTEIDNLTGSTTRRNMAKRGKPSVFTARLEKELKENPKLTTSEAQYLLEQEVKSGKLQGEAPSYENAGVLLHRARKNTGIKQTFKKGAKAKAAKETRRNAVIGENGEELKPMAREPAARFVTEWANKFSGAKKFSFHVFNNPEQMRAENPDLYSKHQAAYEKDNPGSDFDAEQQRVAAYTNFNSGRGDVVVFSDQIYTKKQLAFVIAHEVIGHNGVSAILDRMGGAKMFKDLLLDIHKNSPEVRERTKEIQDSGRESDFYIAVEEAVADMAGMMEASLLNRVIVFVRRMLNKFFGIKYLDEQVYALIDEARAYVRNEGVTFPDQPTRFSKRMDDDAKEAYEQERASVMSALTAVTATEAMMAPGNEKGSLMSTLDSIRKSWNNGEILQNIDAVKNRFFATLIDTAQKSPMLAELASVFADTSGRKLDLVSDMQTRRKLTLTPKQVGGPSDEQLQIAADMLAAGALNRARTATEGGKPLLSFSPDGKVVFDDKAFEEYQAKGILSPEEFKEVKTFFSDGTEGQTFKFKDITKDSPEYKVYLENRKAINELAKQRLLDIIRGNGGLSDAQVDRILNRFGEFKRELTVADRTWFRRVLREYLALYFKESKIADGETKLKDDSVQYANDWLASILEVLHNDQRVLDLTTDREIKDDAPERAKMAREYRDDPIFKDIIDGVKDIRTLGISKDDQIKMLNAFQHRALDNKIIREAEKTARKTIAGGYVPLTRKGKYQVRVKAEDEKGNAIDLDHDYRDKLPYYQVDELAVADEIAADLDKALGQQTWDAYDSSGNKIKVKFKSVREKASETPGLTERISVEQFKEVAVRIGINLKPKDMESIIKALTSAGDRQRKSLERSGTPGWDRDVIKSISEWMERTSAASAKTANRYRIDNLMNDRGLIYGDEKKLKRLQAEFDDAKNQAQRIRAEQALTRYARMYSFVSPVVAGQKTFEINTRRGKLKMQHQGRGQEAAEIAKSLLQFYHKRLDIQEDLEDLLTTHGAPIKTLAVTMQLGGTLGAGIVNTFSIYTHLVPYLSGSSENKGRGGGFGIGRTMAAVTKAISNLANPNLAEREYLQQLVDKREWAKHGMTEAEAIFLLDKTIRGELRPTQMQALLGTTRSKITGRLKNAAIEKWMIPFSYTEALNRRVAALASYRLFGERAAQAGLDTKELLDTTTDFYHELFEETRRAIEFTQGNYALWNRPQSFRGNFAAHVLMYKMFPLNTIEMLGQLGHSHRMAFLATILLMAGVKGLPFADDIMDLLDTILQKMGIRIGSVEYELNKMIDAILPGASPIVMRGVIDAVSGGTFSTRLGLGDIIPFTGVGREGADLGRELQSGFGPIYGAMRDTVDWLGFAGDLSLQYAGLKDRTNNFADLIRRAPAAGLRQFEAINWWMDGQIVDQRGRVVSSEAPWNMLALRALGFYPAEATQQNDIVRLSRYVDDYAKRIKASYVSAWVAARRTNDSARMRQIERDVRDWNRRAEAADQEEFVIGDFRQSAQRAASERGRNTLSRYARTTSRPTVENLAEAYGLDIAR